MSCHFDLQPVLRGELLELRPLDAADFDQLFAVARDPLIWEQHPNHDRYKEEQFRIFFREALASGGALVAAETHDRRIIGSSRFHGYDRERGEIEIGWTFLARAYWGGRYNHEMKRLMFEHAFRFVDRVVFLVGLQNVRSQRAVEKIGGVPLGSRPDAGGRESIVYEISRSPRLSRRIIRSEAADATNEVSDVVHPIHQGDCSRGWATRRVYRRGRGDRCLGDHRTAVWLQ